MEESSHDCLQPVIQIDAPFDAVAPVMDCVTLVTESREIAGIALFSGRMQ